MISKNFSQPLGAQSLRLWQKLRALRRGSLAVPRRKELAEPALPLRRIAQVLPAKRHWRQSRRVLKASAIRAFKAGEILLPIQFNSTSKQL